MSAQVINRTENEFTVQIITVPYNRSMTFDLRRKPFRNT